MEPAIKTDRRIGVLDALRGLAALDVALAHCVSVASANSGVTLQYGFGGVRDVLIDIVLLLADPVGAGLAPVMFFFVLSGFVLSLPYVTQRSLPYWHFVVRRVCRIYLPFAAIISLVSVLYASLVLAGYTNQHMRPVDPLYRLSEAAGQDFGAAAVAANPKPSLISEIGALTLRQLPMKGYDDVQFMDHPQWSLVYEMRISLVFPALCLLLLAVGPRYVMPLLFGLFLVTAALMKRFWPADTPLGTVILTFHYLFLFGAGILVAQLHAKEKLNLSRFSPAFMILLWGVALLPIFPTLVGWSHTAVEFLSCVGGALLIALCLESEKAKRVLSLPPIVWLGRVSYSFYLVHVPILYVTFYLLYGKIPLVFVIAVFAAAAAMTAELSYRYIEVPTNKLGKRLSLQMRTLRAT